MLDRCDQDRFLEQLVGMCQRRWDEIDHCRPCHGLPNGTGCALPTMWQSPGVSFVMSFAGGASGLVVGEPVRPVEHHQTSFGISHMRMRLLPDVAEPVVRGRNPNAVVALIARGSVVLMKAVGDQGEGDLGVLGIMGKDGADVLLGDVAVEGHVVEVGHARVEDSPVAEVLGDLANHLLLWCIKVHRLFEHDAPERLLGRRDDSFRHVLVVLHRGH